MGATESLALNGVAVDGWKGISLDYPRLLLGICSSIVGFDALEL